MSNNRRIIGFQLLLKSKLPSRAQIEARKLLEDSIAIREAARHLLEKAINS